MAEACTMGLLSSAAFGVVIGCQNATVALVTIGSPIIASLLLGYPEIPWAIFSSGLFLFAPLTAWAEQLKGRVAVLVLIVTVTVMVFRRILARQWRLPRASLSDAAVLLLWALIFASQSWSNSRSLAEWKVQGWGLFTALPFLSLRYLYAPSERGLWRLVRLFALLALVGTVIVLSSAATVGHFVPSQGWIQRIWLIESWGVNLFDLTDAFTWGTLSGLAILLWDSKGLFRWGWLALALASLYSQVMVGKRVQTVCTVLAATAVLWYWQRESRGRSRPAWLQWSPVVVGGLALALVFASMWNLAPDWIAQDVSLTGRIEYYRNTIYLIGQRPFLGFGIGAFGVLEGREDTRLFPHNVLLEVWLETGAIGFILLTLFLAVPIARGLKALAASPSAPPRLVLLALGFMAVRIGVGLFSADLVSWRIGFWAALVMLAAEQSSANRQTGVRDDA